jgi:hypothetical protein
VLHLPRVAIRSLYVPKSLGQAERIHKVVRQRGGFVDRRGFLNDATEVGIGLGVTGSLLGKGAALAATSPEEEAGQTH